MDADRWERIQELFHAALDQPLADRRAYLERVCENDDALLHDVLAMLKEDERNPSFLEPALAQMARDVLDGSVPVMRRIGPYRVRKVLGQGGMGVVYLAERDDLQRRAAIKVLRDATLSPARRRRFTREQQMLAQLNHPAIARLYDAAVLPDGTPYFVMEYVDGMPLTEYCDVHECSLDERLTLFAHVCDVVQYAHRQAVIHRDLKPSNIFVCGGPDGTPSIKLLDFGIAKQLQDMGTSAAQTQTGLRLMTPAYAAPEQIRGEPVGVYTDVYALGVVLYELLAGQRPFDLSELTPGQIETVILKRDPDKPSETALDGDGGASVPIASASLRAREDLDVMCLTAMHKDARRRYPTVEALRRDLGHYREGRPLEARPDSARYRVAKFLRRNRQPVVAALLVWVVVTGLVVYYTARVAEQRDRAQSEAAKAERISEYLINLFEASDPYAADSVSARTVLERGVAQAEELGGQPDVQAQMLDVLGRVHTLRSEYDRAEALLQRALRLRREKGTPLDVAETLANLGRLYSDTGAYDSAEVVMREALAVRERHLPPRHPDVAVTLDRLGVALNRQGKYQEAEVLYRLALRIQRDIYDGPHEDLGSTLNNLAVNRFDQGDYAGAERYFRQALAIERQIYGPEHPSIAVGLSNLGVLLDTRGKYVSADSILTEALRIKRMKLGDDHYETAFSLTQLGGMLRRKGDYDRAEAYLRQALAIEARVLGDNHRNTAVTLNHLALTLQGRGDYEEAEPLLRRAVAIFDEHLGAEHPYTTIVQCHLAYVLHLQGKDGQAEQLFHDALPLLEAALPSGHDQLALVRGKYGALLAAQARYAEAESVLVDSHRRLEAHFGPGHPETRGAVERLVNLYEAWNRPEKARQFRQVVAEDAGARGSVAAGPH